jgi:leucyl-tRNA synthetase
MENQKKSTVRRDKLIALEPRARSIWERHQYFMAEPNEKPKFFSTFPYPYMNGTLHLGHAFSMSKVDFNAWYKRLCGYNVLFPFGFHCTGMPISAAAKKLKN